MTATLLDLLDTATAAAAGSLERAEQAEQAERAQEQLGVWMVDALARQRAAEIEVLVCAAAWADAHRVVSEDGAAVAAAAAGGGRALAVAGPGAPEVEDFAVSELGGLMGVCFETAFALLGDAVELSHRLPLLWNLTTVAGTVTVGLAREICEMTRDLSLEAAADADRRLCRSRRRIDRRRARLVIDETRLWHDPDRAIDDEQHALAKRGVWSYPHPARFHTPALTEMYVLLDSLEAHRFETAVGQVATLLGQLGDTDPLDVRRAKAVGVLADPQTALDLLTSSSDQTQPPRSAPAAPAATLYLHLSETALLEDGPVSIERLGTVSKDLIRDWLTGSRVIVRPVLDLGRADAVDQHDPPGWMREQVVLRDRHCIFPGCTRHARGCDLDHIDPYRHPDQGGPPGQTHPDNHAPLCRRHHRAKTHGTLSYHRLPDGSYHWTLPTGQERTVTP
jgi:hypothetical protein